MVALVFVSIMTMISIRNQTTYHIISKGLKCHSL